MQTTLTLNDGQATPVATSFNVQTINGSSASYMAPVSSNSEPLRLSVEVNLKSAGADGSDRVMIRATRVRKNTTTGKPITGGVSLQLVLPRDEVITAQDRKDLKAFVINYIGTSGYFDSLLDGIIP